MIFTKFIDMFSVRRLKLSMQLDSNCHDRNDILSLDMAQGQLYGAPREN